MLERSLWNKSNKNNNKSKNNNSNTEANLQTKMPLAKYHKITHKIRLKTDIQNQDFQLGKNRKVFPQSTKNSVNGRNNFFWNGKPDHQKQPPSKLSVFQHISQKSQKPSKKHSFKNQTENINYSGYFKKKEQKILSFEKIYMNSQFSPNVRGSQEKLSKNKSPKKESEPFSNLQEMKHSKKKASVLFHKRKYSLTQTHSRSIEKQLNKLKLTKNSNNKNNKSQTNPIVQKQSEKYNLLTKKPISSQQAIKCFRTQLKNHEIIEIGQFQEIYYLCKNNEGTAKKIEGFDDKKGHYIIKPHDHIIYRYEVLQLLGKGSFGQVFKSYDHKKQEYIALKIIRNRPIPNSQARIQYSILQYIKEASEQNCFNIVSVKESFIFRNHFFMTFELLSCNLYELIKVNKFLPLSLELIRRISIQVLSALLFLFKHNIIHCDIKPENILLRNSEKSGIKVIDFGSSCFADQKLYTYIQSRYYRAPQVILGYDYSTEIDMWSFGCVTAQLRLSYPIFSGQDEEQQIALITQVIGLPQKQFYEKCQRGFDFFKEPISLKDRDGNKIEQKSRSLTKLFNETDFIDFLERIFIWDPKKRISPLQALRHPWILKGLPKQIKQQHLEFLAEQEIIIQNIIKTRQANKTKILQETQGKTISQSLMMQALKAFQ